MTRLTVNGLSTAQRAVSVLVAVATIAWAAPASAAEFVIPAPIRVAKQQLRSPLYLKVVGEATNVGLAAGTSAAKKRADVALLDKALAAMLARDYAAVKNTFSGPPERLTQSAITEAVDRAHKRYSRYRYFNLTHIFKLENERLFVVDAKTALGNKRDTVVFTIAEDEQGRLSIPIGVKPSDLATLISRAARLSGVANSGFFIQTVADFRSARRGAKPLTERSVVDEMGNVYALLFETPIAEHNVQANDLYDRFLNASERGDLGKLTDAASQRRITNNVNADGGAQGAEFYRFLLGTRVHEVLGWGSDIAIAFMQPASSDTASPYAKSIIVQTTKSGQKRVVNLYYQDTLMRWLNSAAVRKALANEQS